MSNLSQFKEWLQHISFLTNEDCNLFEPYLIVKQFTPKSFFLKEGTTCKYIGFVNSGAFRTYYLADGKEINTQFVFENQFVGDYDSFIQQKPAKYNIQALENCEVVCFNAAALQHGYDVSKNWERFGRLIAESAFKKTTERVESFLFLNGEQRYKQLLEQQPYILTRVPLYHIASYLGIERETLSRLRKKITQ